MPKIRLKNALFYILGTWFACLNDLMNKYLALHISVDTIVFWRFTIGFICIIIAIPFSYFFVNKSDMNIVNQARNIFSRRYMPILWRHSIDSLKTKHLIIHIFRGILFAAGLVCWSFALIVVDLPSAVTISFLQPLIVVILAKIFLKENVHKSIYLLSFISFIGTIVVLDPLNANFSPQSILLIVATILWGFVEMLNKKMLNNGESMISIFFYSTIGSLIVMLPFILRDNVSIALDTQSLSILILYGISGQLMILCYLCGMRDIDANVLTPLRYLEVVFAAPLSYLVFSQIPGSNFYIGTLIILIATAILTSISVKSNIAKQHESNANSSKN